MDGTKPCAAYMARRWGSSRRERGVDSCASNQYLQNLGSTQNHFSTVSLEAGFRRSTREISAVSNTFLGFDFGKLEDEYDVSSKTGSPVGSNWKTTTWCCADQKKGLIFSWCEEHIWLFLSRGNKEAALVPGWYISIRHNFQHDLDVN